MVGVAVLFYLLSGEEGGTGRGLVDRITRFLPLYPIKIIIVSWQILTQVSHAAAPPLIGLKRIEVLNIRHTFTFLRLVDCKVLLLVQQTAYITHGG